MAENRCPLIENCQQKSAVCNVQLPDETCYWFRWFRALANPWHTGTPTEEGDYLVRVRVNGNKDTDFYQIMELNDFISYLKGQDKFYAGAFYKVLAWQKIEPYKEKEDGHTD